MPRCSSSLLAVLSLLGVLLVLSSTTAYAQRPTGDRAARMQAMMRGVVNGTVVDDDTGSPIATASVAVWRVRDSTLVTGAITDLDGTFTIESLLPGRYYVKLSFVGYTTEVVEDIGLRPQAFTADLGTVRLSPDTAQMEGVEVTAERDLVEMKIDRTVYNTKDQPALAGGNAQDVLENIPSVEVDIDGNISLRGNGNVAVLVNGRPMQMSGEMLAGYLQSLSSDMIESVEVIPNPSAKFDPEGLSGILNIVLKKDAEIGWSGGFSTSANTTSDYNASGNLGMGRGKLNARVNYGFRYNTRNTDGTRFQANRFRQPTDFLDQLTDGDRVGSSHLGTLDLDYQLSDKNALNLSTQVSQRTGDNTGLNAYFELGADETLMNRFDRLSEDDGTSFRTDHTLAFRRIIERGEHELTAEMRLETDRRDDEEQFTQQVLTGAGNPANSTPELQNSRDEQRTIEGTFQIDYTRPLAGGKFETGWKSDLRTLDSEFFAQSFDYTLNAYSPDVSLNNTFRFDEQIYAAYAIYGRKAGKFNMQGGVRLEQAVTTFDLATTQESFDNNYFSIFPSAFLTYDLVQGKQLKASYSKRISRPRTRQLNPFSAIDDPLFLRQGNPFLQPEYTHSMEVSYSQFSRSSSFTLTPYYRNTVDVIRRLQTLDETTGVSTLTFANFASRRSYGAESIGTYRISGLLSAFASLNVYRLETNGSNIGEDFSSGSLAWSSRINATFETPFGPSIQFSYFYRSPVDIEQGRIEAFQAANMAIQQKVLNNQGTISLRGSDLFGTLGFELYRDDARFYQESSRNWDAQNVTLAFTYTFGQQDRRRDRRSRGGGMDFDPEDM